MKNDRSSRILYALVVLAFLLSASSGVLLFRQELERRQAGVQYQAFQVMTGIVEVYSMDESFDPASWPAVKGFGIYGPDGASEYRYGSAPEVLGASDIPETFSVSRLSVFSGSSLVMIRQTGSMPPMMGSGMRRRSLGPIPEMGGRVPDLGPRGMMPMHGHGEGKNRLVYLDLDVGRSVAAIRFVFALAAVLVLVFMAILALLAHYSRKLNDYRAREEENSRLVQLGEAARTLAHEIKNPLGVISVQCATMSRTLPGEFGKHIDVIMEETGRLSLLADRIRDFLRNSAGTPQECRAADFIEQCRVRYEGRVLVSVPPAENLVVYVDPSRMTQVLDNLVANAIEATEAARRLRSDSEAIPSLPLVSLSVVKGRAAFSVVDRGIGVALENRPRLFSLFFTTKAKGSGLGLALARRFVEQAGGTLEYSEASGGGSVFTASLPLRDAWSGA